jgi:allantoin racemase
MREGRAAVTAARQAGAPMRLLIVNPNTSERVTEVIVREAERVASPGTEVIAATARFGPSYIETQGEAVVAAHATLEALAEHATACDAAIIAAFADPGLDGARAMLDIPVIGIAEAAMTTASLLGNRFSLISISRRMIPLFHACVERNGRASRLASVRMLEGPVRDVAAVRVELEAPLVELCHRAVDEDGADVVILAGGPLAGLAEQVANRITVPVVDGVASAVRLAEGLAAGYGRRRRPVERRLSEKTFTGISSALAGILGGA